MVGPIGLGVFANLSKIAAGFNSKAAKTAGEAARHHSDLLDLGGAVKQNLTSMTVTEHVALHNAMQKHMSGYTSATGRSMAHSNTNPGVAIQQEFSRSQILGALRDFYNGPGHSGAPLRVTSLVSIRI